MVSWLKICHYCLCYMFHHVHTSWPFGVLEYHHVNRVQYFEYFCPWTPCSIQKFSTDFTIHKLSSLLYTSQVYSFKYGLKSFLSFVTNWKELTYNQRKWHSNTNPQSVKCLTHSQQLSHLGSRQVVLNQFLLIDVFLIVIRIDFPLFFLLPCKLSHVCLRNEFLIKTFIYYYYVSCVAGA